MYTIFLPLLIQVGLTLTILIFVPKARIAAIKADPSLLKKASLDMSVYPDEARKVANNFDNQFQLPVLFYLACVLAILFGATGLWAGIFAWAFVGLRIAHTLIHTGSNVTLTRFRVFAGGLAALIGLWVVVVIAAANSPMLTGMGG